VFEALNEYSSTGLSQLELLLQQGAQVNIYNNRHETPLHIAASNKNRNAVCKLIEAQADINAKKKLQSTILHTICKYGTCPNQEYIEFLVNKGADPNAVMLNGRTPLFEASQRGHNSIVSLFVLQFGCSLNLKDSTGNTPLHVAIFANMKRTSQLLVMLGADVNIKNDTGSTPQVLANNRKWKLNEMNLSSLLEEASPNNDIESEVSSEGSGSVETTEESDTGSEERDETEEESGNESASG